MEKLFVALCMLISISAISQNDKLYLHTGKTIEGTVIRSTESAIIYKYAGEDAEQTLGKYAVDKIVYGKSGREEKVSDKVLVTSKDDWDKVIILEDKSEVTGLIKVDEIKGKTGMINYRSAANSDKKSEERLKQEAANMGCQFVLMTSDKDPGSGTRVGLGRSQSIKKGIAYKY